MAKKKGSKDSPGQQGKGDEGAKPGKKSGERERVSRKAATENQAYQAGWRIGGEGEDQGARKRFA